MLLDVEVGVVAVCAADDAEPLETKIEPPEGPGVDASAD
jgi:hypothetical protein